MAGPVPTSHDGSTSKLLAVIDRMRGGDATAVDELLVRIEGRMRFLTHRMLRDFPTVRAWEQTDDVCQMAILRLHRSLRTVEIVDSKHVLGLATAQIRRVLLTLAKRYRGRMQAGPGMLDGGAGPAGLVPETAPGPDELERWTEFHAAIERLPAASCEVFDLLFYQGLSQEEAAEVLSVTDRTVRTRWRRARLELIEKMDGQLPDF